MTKSDQCARLHQNTKEKEICMEKQGTSPEPARLDRLDPEIAAALKAAGQEMRSCITQILKPIEKFDDLLFSPEGEKVQGATDIQAIIGLFLVYSLEGNKSQDIPGLISDRLQRSEKSIEKILGLLGLV